MHPYDLFIMPELINLQVVEHMASCYLHLFSGKEYLKVVPYPDMVLDIVLGKKTKSIFPNEFLIGQKTVDAVFSKPVDETLYQGYALIRIGIDSLVEHLEHR